MSSCEHVGARRSSTGCISPQSTSTTTLWLTHAPKTNRGVNGTNVWVSHGGSVGSRREKQADKTTATTRHRKERGKKTAACDFAGSSSPELILRQSASLVHKRERTPSSERTRALTELHFLSIWRATALIHRDPLIYFPSLTAAPDAATGSTRNSTAGRHWISCSPQSFLPALILRDWLQLHRPDVYIFCNAPKSSLVFAKFCVFLESSVIYRNDFGSRQVPCFQNAQANSPSI